MCDPSGGDRKTGELRGKDGRAEARPRKVVCVFQVRGLSKACELLLKISSEGRAGTSVWFRKNKETEWGRNGVRDTASGLKRPVPSVQTRSGWVWGCGNKSRTLPVITTVAL